MEDYMEDDILTSATTTSVERLLDALIQHDVDAMMASMTSDCVFEDWVPKPDGARYVGQQAVRRFWEGFFQRSPDARLDIEEVFAAGDSCAVRYVWRWAEADGTEQYVRCAALFLVRSGHVAEMRFYAKG